MNTSSRCCFIRKLNQIPCARVLALKKLLGFCLYKTYLFNQPRLKEAAIKNVRNIQTVVYVPWIVILLSFLMLSNQLLASNQVSDGARLYASSDEVYVPPELDAWVPWVLASVPDARCPFNSVDPRMKRCFWPGALNLGIQDQVLSFSQQWQAYASGWLYLPGGTFDQQARHWPHSVTLNGKPVPVLMHDGRPAIWVTAGDHQITGVLRLPRETRYVYLPPSFALLNWREGRRPQYTRLDEGGRLWLTQQAQNGVQEERPYLAFRLFRKFEDAVPVRLTSRLELEVSGAERVIRITNLALPHTRSMSHNSPLPVKWAGDDLLIRVKPGRWVLNVQSRFLEDIVSYQGDQALKVPDVRVFDEHGKTDSDQDSPPGMYPQARLWVLSTQSHFRALRTQGLVSLDPARTALPKAWQNHSVFQPKTGASWHWQEIETDFDGQGREALTLKRTVWPDFKGRGLTVEDQIQGELGQLWRLTTRAPLEPGRAMLDEEPLVITSLGEGSKGIELRQTPTHIKAISQYADRHQSLPITGWQHDFQQVSWALQLPVNWVVLAISGVDRVTGTWWTQWRLWDVFWVVLLSALFIRLCRLSVGLLMAALLALTYGTANSLSPLLWALTVLALFLGRLAWGSVPKLKVLATILGFVVVIIWACVVVPHVYDGLRQMLFGPAKQEVQWNNKGAYAGASLNEKPLTSASQFAQMEPEMALELDEFSDVGQSSRQKLSLSKNSFAEPGAKQLPYPQRSYPQQQNFMSKDIPNAYNAQTGPGLPRWRSPHNQVYLEWSGPVSPEAEVRIYWLPPWASRALWAVKIMLWLSALWVLVYWFGARAPLLTHWWRRYPLPIWLKVSAPALLVCMLPLGLFALPSMTMAATKERAIESHTWPTPALLDELSHRLTQPPACERSCFAVEKAHVGIDQQKLTVKYTIHTQAQLYARLPHLDSDMGWPEQVRVESDTQGQPVASLDHDSDFNPVVREGSGKQASHSLVMLHAPGVYNILLSGPAPSGHKFQLTFPWALSRVSVSTNNGWRSLGLTQGVLAADTLFFERQLEHVQSQSSGQAWVMLPAPPFVRIERAFIFDHAVEVHTQVHRVSPQEGAIHTVVPLLPDESVLTQGISVKEEGVQVNLAAGQSSIFWRSLLRVNNALEHESQERNPLKIRLTAPSLETFSEQWRFNISEQWHLKFQGMEPVLSGADAFVQHNPNHNNNRVRLWQPTYWPQAGEQLEITGRKLASVPGQNMTIDAALFKFNPGVRSTEGVLKLTVNNSVGQILPITLPKKAEQIEISVNGQKLPVGSTTHQLEPVLAPGLHTVNLKFSLPQGISSMVVTPELELPRPLVNLETHIQLPISRWVLWTSGPGVGPSVSFWAAVLLIFLVAPLVARSQWIELTAGQWIGLALGFSLCFWPGIVLFLLALVALKTKPIWPMFLRGNKAYNCSQVCLMLLCGLVLLGFVIAVPSSLLANPKMAIIGPHAMHNQFIWYMDRLGASFPVSTVVSIPMWCYRLVMLAWSLWLANQLIHWSQWGWKQLGLGGWFKFKKKKVAPEPEKATSGTSDTSE